LTKQPILLAFHPRCFFAWTFEMTPDGIKQEDDVDRSQPGRTSARRSLDYVIMDDGRPPCC